MKKLFTVVVIATCLVAMLEACTNQMAKNDEFYEQSTGNGQPKDSIDKGDVPLPPNG